MMEEKITGAIVRRYSEKLQRNLSVDVALVGAGPAGLVAARDLANAGLRAVVFESQLAPGGGIWGGGMLMNEIVVQEDALPILRDFNVRTQCAGDGYHTCDAVEMASGLIFGARQAGAIIFNAMRIEDIVFHDDRVCGVVVQWSPVAKLGLHVDPLVVTARAVVDSTGHPSEIVAMATRKAGLQIDTPTGAIMGEKPVWMESGEQATVINTKRLYPGLYVAGMAANNVSGGFRMGPVFGGMLKSGRKIADVIRRELAL